MKKVDFIQVQQKSAIQTKLEQSKKRIGVLDNLFKHIYEDNVAGKISDTRFVKLASECETEQKNSNL